MLTLWLLGCLVVVHEDDTSPPATCEQVEDAFQAELARVQACSVAAQCGQVLAGTSCGCTRNLVARLDADTQDLYALMDQAASWSCDLGLTSPCDCPETDGFTCHLGRCAWDYTITSPLPACRAEEGDPYTITAAAIVADELRLTLQASGGCAEHDWTLCWPDGTFMESWPVQARLDVLHDDHDDPCDAIVSEDRAFDLSPLRDAWREAYGASSGTIRIRVAEYDLSYSF